MFVLYKKKDPLLEDNNNYLGFYYNNLKYTVLYPYTCGVFFLIKQLI